MIQVEQNGPKIPCAGMCTLSYTRTLAAMLSLGEIAQIKGEIERLERLRKECTDTGIRKPDWGVDRGGEKEAHVRPIEGRYSLKKKSSPYALQVKLQPTKPTPEPLTAQEVIDASTPALPLKPGGTQEH